MFTCPCCDGECEFGVDRIEYIEITYPCGFCNGRGKVSLWAWLYWLWIGGFHNED